MGEVKVKEIDALKINDKVKELVTSSERFSPLIAKIKDEKNQRLLINFAKGLYLSPYQFLESEIEERIEIFTDILIKLGDNSKAYMPGFASIFQSEELPEVLILAIQKLVRASIDSGITPKNWGILYLHFSKYLRTKQRDLETLSSNYESSLKKIDVLKKEIAGYETQIAELKATIEKGGYIAGNKDEGKKNFTVEVMKEIKKQNLAASKRLACIEFAPVICGYGFTPSECVKFCASKNVTAEMLCEYRLFSDKELFLAIKDIAKTSVDIINARKMREMEVPLSEILQLMKDAEFSDLDLLNVLNNVNLHLVNASNNEETITSDEDEMEEEPIIEADIEDEMEDDEDGEVEIVCEEEDNEAAAADEINDENVVTIANETVVLPF